jgi:cyclic beta-1,2-glucan synthetase
MHATAGARSTSSGEFTFSLKAGEPLRCTIAGPVLLRQAANNLARHAGAGCRLTSRALLRRARENAERLRSTHQALLQASAQHEQMPAAAEWFLDNFYIIDETAQTVRKHLPWRYARELPAVAADSFRQLPRVFALAVDLIARTDAALNEEEISDFVNAYQEVCPLSIGEVWAVPIMLRMALLESLRRLGDRILQIIADTKAATELVNRTTSAGRFARLPDNPSGAFLLTVRDRLRDHGPPPGITRDELIAWMGRHLSDADGVCQREYHQQAADQVSVGNCVTSLRLLDVLDWADFFEAVSVVEKELRRDPGGIYPRQDFKTRDRCRQAVERLARGSKLTELEVARLANRSAAADQDERHRHVTWHLLGEGRDDLERKIKYRPFWPQRCREGVRRHPNLIYFGLMTLFMAGSLSLFLVPLPPLWWLALILILVPVSEIAVVLTNYVVCKLVPPRVLPKLNFRGGIEHGCDTFVVMPTMLDHPEQIAGLAKRLEYHFLSNPDPRLWFALLTDFTDADHEHEPGDESKVQAGLEAIRTLNEKYAAQGGPRFFLFHRHRLFNPSEGRWMGWERKRGKLEEFNRLLRGDDQTSYSVLSAKRDQIPYVKYVLTLDADTVLPRDAARHMISTLAHPLNQPRLSDDGRRVEAGYAILQPRVSFLYKTGFQSWFARIFAYSAGVDPYSTASSDAYMDLFGKGSFTGKGLYEVDAFHATAGRTFPDNTILSHDLIESNYARCALATDIEVFDGFPARYNAFAKREHRWIRGDWQLLPWLGSTVPSPEGGRVKNPLPLLERWKVLDNLRRSLVPVASVVLLLCGWTFLPGSAWTWTALALGPLLMPTLLSLVELVLHVVAVEKTRALYLYARSSLATTLAQFTLQVLFLANQAALVLDAVLRTLYRLVSRRHLLEWETAAAAERRLKNDLASFMRAMWPSLLLALLTAGLLFVVPAGQVPVLLLFAVAWAAAPLVACWVSQPRKVGDRPLTGAEVVALRKLTRQIWEFYETFVGPEDHWLPPDNYQEEPTPMVAHRTSPTNIGLYLNACLGAHDLGYLTLPALVERVRNTLETLSRLERHHGHFLNWYDTTSLTPLLPAYVSTVDSGNLFACLLVLKQGLLELAEKPSNDSRYVAALRDTVEWLITAAGQKGASAGQVNTQRSLDVLRDELADRDRIDDSLLLRIEKQVEYLLGLENLNAEVTRWAMRLHAMLHAIREERRTSSTTAARHDELRALAERSQALATAIDFKFLYNPDRELFVIGFNATTNRPDRSHYDLLASEACITSFLMIAFGQVPREHWFQLGRLTTQLGGEPGLLSWGGTMFEYLMPRIFLPAPSGTLLDQAQQVAVRRQRAYGQETGLPWGISESGFNLQDTAFNYQYQSFGVPGLGLKRGLEQDRVVAPYATQLAVSVDPHEALKNLERLRQLGGEGRFGFYEALDFTQARVETGEKYTVIKSYMAHHQAMGFLAILNRLTDNIMHRRLRNEPAVRAAELLLEERIPIEAPVIPAEQLRVEEGERGAVAPLELPVSRRISTPFTPTPRTHLISNNYYTVMINNVGSGFSRWRHLDVTRWRNDATTDNHGTYLYLRDRRSGACWSAGYQPTCTEPEYYDVTFSVDKADIRRVDDDIESLLEVTVVPDQDVEVRRLSLLNLGTRPRELEVTSYAEVVLQEHGADLAHPAFGKLFLETEWLPEETALLCHRRPRSPGQAPVWAVHALAADGPPDSITWETDRAKFIGRRQSLRRPAALTNPSFGLSETAGPVLDPILSIRRRVRLRPGERIVLAFTTGVTDSRESAVQLSDQYKAMHSITRAFELGWAESRVEMQHLGIKAEQVHIFQRLAGHLIYPTSHLRAPANDLLANRGKQADLWKYGISGDLPLVVARITSPPGLQLARELLQAHAYLRKNCLQADLLFILENASGYYDDLYAEVVNETRRLANEVIDRPGGVFIRKTQEFSPGDHTLVLAVARAVLDDLRGSLIAHLDAMPPARSLPPRSPQFTAAPARPTNTGTFVAEVQHGLQFRNGIGGFAQDGDEYVIAPNHADRVPPAPWSNVVANPEAGFLVTEGGGGCTWVGNSQSNRLTPWSNDPVLDMPGEMIYLRDEATGEYWCPTPLPVWDDAPVVVRHGQGYTIFERECQDLYHELTAFVPAEDPVKLWVLKVRNQGKKRRKLSATFFAELVIGTTREATSGHVTTAVDPATGALLAYNRYHPDLSSHVAFADVNCRPRTYTGDRAEFLGRQGEPGTPAALERIGLSKFVGPGLDPCFALQAPIELNSTDEVTIVFVLGQVDSEAKARELVSKYCHRQGAQNALEQVVNHWDGLLGTVTVSTPDPAFNFVMNRWLLYQTLSCRVWGRTAFYQSSGAFGFRDQLQDVLALLYAAPRAARQHLLRAAARQFVEGDVQHWWHPPSGAGVRTMCSDDFLWLPYAVCRYVEATGDESVLLEKVPFLHGEPLRPGQHDAYATPEVAQETGTLFEHCVRALAYGWRRGIHGLPLIGNGDWNDGMNMVGPEGRGESVWLAWFQYVCRIQFAELARRHNEPGLAENYVHQAEQLRSAAEEHAWDGAWYRRAYFDDGTPLGSASNSECQIDSLPQSWAVISGAADPGRAERAVASALRRLVHRDDRLVLLFDPPFDQGPLQPGYIKGYVPGIRENGGQYTHAASWMVKALAMLGRGNDAFSVFNLINPVRGSTNLEQVGRYRVEPYVAPGDVYGHGRHRGRGGWTWYTGSAGWLYRVGLEDLLGLRVTDDVLTVRPVVPDSWNEYQIVYRYRNTVYRIKVVPQPAADWQLELDGQTLPVPSFKLIDDGKEHQVIVRGVKPEYPPTSPSADRSGIVTGTSPERLGTR